MKEQPWRDCVITYTDEDSFTQYQRNMIADIWLSTSTFFDCFAG